jgi:hypothetical protein
VYEGEIERLVIRGRLRNNIDKRERALAVREDTTRRFGK